MSHFEVYKNVVKDNLECIPYCFLFIFFSSDVQDVPYNTICYAVPIPATTCSPFCHLANDIEVSTALPPDSRAASFLSVWDF